MSNKIKSQQLGMNYSTAYHRLRKVILFELVRETSKDVCYQCGNRIQSVDDLSIEHIRKWQYSENPKELFFDLNNIAFSHLKCNIIAGNKRGLKGPGKTGEYAIYFENDGRPKPWKVYIYRKEKGKAFIKSFLTKDEAIQARDEWLGNNPN